MGASLCEPLCTRLGRVRTVVETLYSQGLEACFDLNDIEALADFPRRIRDGLGVAGYCGIREHRRGENSV